MSTLSRYPNTLKLLIFLLVVLGSYWSISQDLARQRQRIADLQAQLRACQAHTTSGTTSGTTFASPAP